MGFQNEVNISELSALWMNQSRCAEQVELQLYMRIIKQRFGDSGVSDPSLLFLLLQQKPSKYNIYIVRRVFSICMRFLGLNWKLEPDFENTRILMSKRIYENSSDF